MDALLRADNTQNRLVLDVRGTAQRATHSDYVVEIKSTVEINLMKTVAFMIAVQTRVLSGVEIFICCIQHTRVLGRPARRTGVGAGHHDAGGQRDPAHGAGQEVIPATLQDIPEVTTDDDATVPFRKAVKLRCLGQTQRVGAGSLNVVVFACNKSCAATQREELSLNNHMTARIGSKTQNTQIQLFLDLLMILPQRESDYHKDFQY